MPAVWRMELSIGEVVGNLSGLEESIPEISPFTNVGAKGLPALIAQDVWDNRLNYFDEEIHSQLIRGRPVLPKCQEFGIIQADVDVTTNMIHFWCHGGSEYQVRPRDMRGVPGIEDIIEAVLSLAIRDLGKFVQDRTKLKQMA